MKTRFCTDFHLGASLRSHTNARSQEAFRAKLFDVGISLVNGHAADHVIMLGDLFDKHSNKEDIIIQGSAIADCCEIILAGNHDQINIDGQQGSLDVLKKNGVCHIVMSPNLGRPHVAVHELTGDPTAYQFIPHCLTQEVFEASVRDAVDLRTRLDQKQAAILCLHCNVGDSRGTEIEAEGSSLYLTSELQELTKAAFTFVLVGHEHVPRQDENLIVLGNSHPISFGEIADRFVYEYDVKTRKMSKTKIFDATTEYEQIEAIDLIDCEGKIDTACSMVEIVGELLPEDQPKLSRALLAFWRTNEDTLLAVKNSINIPRAEAVKARVKMCSLRETLDREARAAGFAAELELLAAEYQKA